VPQKARVEKRGRWEPCSLFEFLGLDVLTGLFEVVLINLVLSGDNLIVISLAAAGLPHAQRSKAILIGIVAATAFARSARRLGYTNSADRRPAARGRDPAVVGVLENLARAARLLRSAGRSDRGCWSGSRGRCQR
jgi:Integral membrane protein TerC family